MDSSLLKIFIAVANNKSVSLGALELGFAQSNVTARIKQLEKNIGFTLFHRVPKGVKLTHEGEKLYPYAVEIVKKVDEALFHMKNRKEQNVLKIGSTQANASVRLLPFVTKLNKDFPKMKVELFPNTTPLIIEDLLEYKIDVGFVSGNPNHKDIMVLKRFEEDIFIIEPKDKECENNVLGYKDSCEYFSYMSSYQKEHNNSTFKSMTYENYETIVGCVSSGMGVSVVPQTIIEKYGYMDKLKMTKIDPKKRDLATYLVCRKDYIPMIEEYLREIEL